MELDSRVIDGKRPLTCLDIDNAKHFLGKKGYFSNYLNVYANISLMKEDVLQSLDEHHNNEHHDETYIASRVKWKFFLPAEWVKEPKTPEFEPYNLVTWANDFKIGDTVFIRKKEEDFLYKGIYNGWSQGANGDIHISLGAWVFMLTELFHFFEIYRNGNWEPVGKKTSEGE